MKFGVIGAGHAFNYQVEALNDLGFDLIICDYDKSKLTNFENICTNYHDLVGLVDTVLISTCPISHFKLIKYFLDNGLNVICEKPLVVSCDELDYLKDKNFYNILHFSFGDEVEWFINSLYKNLIPNKIEAFINDPYIENNHIKKERVNMHGSYLDEAINPLSAVAKIYGYNIQSLSLKKENYKDDLYDYKSTSKFLVNNIPLTINTLWNDYDDKSKYIDIYFDDFTIRLDSINASVINLTTNEILYKSEFPRMYKHYLNGFKDYLMRRNNETISIILHQELLKYYK